jgi:hypothetical protein
MFAFDPAKLTFETARLKSITTALGGSARIVADSTSEKETYDKIDIPMAVARIFQKEAKSSKFLNPLLVCLTKYDGEVVAVEKHENGASGEEFSEGLSGDLVRWISKSESTWKSRVLPIIQTSGRDWMFDGVYAYTYKQTNQTEAARNGKFLTADGQFRVVDVSAIKLSDLPIREDIEPGDRASLSFVASTGETVITPPIWKDLAGAGSSKIDDADDTFQFDEIDSQLAVNLQFILTAGSTIGDAFGFQSIECLQIPRLMINLRTVNLCKIEKSVKQTYASGMSFKHIAAWLMGMMYRATSFEQMKAVRSLLKQLTTKGVFRNDLFRQELIFKKDKTMDNVTMKTKDEADADSLDVANLANIATAIGTSSIGASVGTLYGAE